MFGALLGGENPNPRFYQGPQQIAGVLILVFVALFFIINAIRIARTSGRLGLSALANFALAIIPLLLIGIKSIDAVNYASACKKIGPNAPLQYCNLSNQDLRQANLSGANLANAQLNGTNLQNANLSEANLTNADLSNAILTNANLENVVLDSAKMQNVIGMTDIQLAKILNVTIDMLSTTLSKKNIPLESRESIFNEIKGACQGIGVTEASVYMSNDSFHPVLLLGNTNFSVEKNWEPMALRFIEFVVCTGEEKVLTIETCNYIEHPSEQHVTIKRFAYQQEFTLVAAKTGTTLVEQSISGALPGECPNTATGGVGDISGEKVSSSDVEKWLAGFVNPP